VADGGSESFSDEESIGGSEDQEVEDESQEGTHSVQPNALVDLGVNMGGGDWQLVGVQAARTQLEAIVSEEPIGLRQVEGGVGFEFLMGTGGEGTEGREEGIAMSAEKGQQLRSRLGENLARGCVGETEACGAHAQERDPPSNAIGLGQLGLRLSDFIESEESITMGGRGATSKTGRKSKKCPLTLGIPKFVQLNEKLNEGRGRKGRGGEKKRKDKEVVNVEEKDRESGDVLEVVLPICPLTPVSGLNFFMEELGTMVPDTPFPDRVDLRCKEVDATRLLNLGKEAGITFNVIDGEVVKSLVNMEKADEENKVVRERNVGDQ